MFQVLGGSANQVPTTGSLCRQPLLPILQRCSRGLKTRFLHRTGLQNHQRTTGLHFFFLALRTFARSSRRSSRRRSRRTGSTRSATSTRSGRQVARMLGSQPVVGGVWVKCFGCGGALPMATPQRGRPVGILFYQTRNIELGAFWLSRTSGTGTSTQRPVPGANSGEHLFSQNVHER